MALLGALSVLEGCDAEGPCVVPAIDRTGAPSEVCFHERQRTCLAHRGDPKEPEPRFETGKTCTALGYVCAGNGMFTGSRRPLASGACPPGTERSP